VGANRQAAARSFLFRAEDELLDDVKTVTATSPAVEDLVALNNDHATELSWVDADWFRRLLSIGTENRL
jgi:hypothetical protein